MESFLLQASIYLGAAVVVVPLSVRLGLGSVLGYLAAGILMGPVMGLAGAETSDLQEFAEFGVVLMLFLIGLELRPQALWDMRHRLIGMGGLQVGLTMAAVAGAAVLFGLDVAGGGHSGHVGGDVLDRDRVADPVRKGPDADRRRARNLCRSVDAGSGGGADSGGHAVSGAQRPRCQWQRKRRLGWPSR